MTHYGRNPNIEPTKYESERTADSPQRLTLSYE